jgi:uncharacterized membrane protein YbhN (UPF0104 family)
VDRKKRNRIIKFVVKLVLTVLAVWFVFRKIDFPEFVHTLRHCNYFYFTLAVLFFMLSKAGSAFRQNELYSAAGIRLRTTYNLKLYAVGMFYNLFLPGSIGGDAYKVYLLKNAHPTLSTRKLISASLLDRISGVVILFVMMCGFLLLSSLQSLGNWFMLGTAAALVLAIPFHYLVVRLFFKTFVSKFRITTLQSLLVQAGQVLCALCLMRAVRIDGHEMDYLSLFMLSSVVAVLPFTIGGVGARELVFVYCAQWLFIDKEVAVVFSMLFFIVSALSSLPGLIFIPRIDQINVYSLSMETSAEGK